MDLVAACRVFVQVGERGSFTLGAAAAGVPQSVASRRVAALEEHLGERLFDRSARRAALTPFGRDMLAPARELARLAEALEYQAGLARLRPVSLAVPGTCPVRALAELKAAAREKGTELDFRPAGPAKRARLVATAQVRAALVAAAPDGADWTVPLGVADTSPGTDPGAGPVRLESLRPGRTQRTPRRIQVQPEDDVPHVRDRLQQAGHRAGLLPAQVTVAPTAVDAASAALGAGDLLLCSAAEARELGLRFRTLAGAGPAARGYRAATADGHDPGLLRDILGAEIARMLGAAGTGEDGVS
ncbi:MAG: LysR family transcriptional regulator [Actinomycetia bacterium]|nr:LysR family transcriptional regulator [Actinomycetes bacterium]